MKRLNIHPIQHPVRIFHNCCFLNALLILKQLDTQSKTGAELLTSSKLAYSFPSRLMGVQCASPGRRRSSGRPTHSTDTAPVGVGVMVMKGGPKA